MPKWILNPLVFIIIVDIFMVFFIERVKFCSKDVDAPVDFRIVTRHTAMSGFLS